MRQNDEVSSFFLSLIVLAFYAVFHPTQQGRQSFPVIWFSHGAVLSIINSGKEIR